MKNFLVVSLSILISLSSVAQEAAPPAEAPPAESTDGSVAAPDPAKLPKPKSRQKTKPGNPPNDSSSFIGDPDNLDPLNVNNESLREDDEPVLEDIKDVLNSKKKKKTPPPSNAAAEAPAASPSDAPVDAPPPEVTPEAPPPVVEAPPPPAPEPPPAPTVAADDPDLALEKKFHDIYQTYNKNPTPDDIWAEASGKQTARLYEVQKGDTLWSISKILFGDPNFWPKLWAINKQGILNPHFINPKMKIFFYEGTEEEAPTLTVGENAPAEEPKETAVAGDGAAAGAEGAPAGTPAEEKPNLTTEEQKIAEAGKVARSKYKPLRNIPPSLPEGRNLVYFEGANKKKVKEMRIDLGQEPRSEFFYANDIVITDVNVKSDVVLRISEVEKMRCSPGRLFKDIDFSGALVDQYDIYERLPGLQTSTGFKYTYRLTGTAKSYKDKYLSVVDCNSFVATDLIFVPKNQMKELATQKISDLEFPTLIGAPDNSEQKFYAPLQYAFVDFGPKNYNVGESFRLLSELTDAVNGEFKVIEKFGSYAVVIMTEVKEQILIGDRVIEP